MVRSFEGNNRPGNRYGSNEAFVPSQPRPPLVLSPIVLTKTQNDVRAKASHLIDEADEGAQEAGATMID